MEIPAGEAWQGAGLFDGAAAWPVTRLGPYPGDAIAEIGLLRRDHEITREGQDRYLSLYRGGPEFITAQPGATAELFRYEVTGSCAAMAFEHLGGRVFLAGFQ